MLTVEEKARQRIKGLEREEGYFTLEASFLVPILCFLAVGIVMLGLYLCDLNMAKSYLSQRVLELSKDDTAYGDTEKKADMEALENRLFMATMTDYSVSKTEWRVKGELELTMNLSVPLVGEWMGNLWKHSFCLTVDRGNNTEQMRRWDQIE